MSNPNRFNHLTPNQRPVPDIEASEPLSDSEKRKLGATLGVLVLAGSGLVAGNIIAGNNKPVESPSPVANVTEAGIELADKTPLPATADGVMKLETPAK